MMRSLLLLLAGSVFVVLAILTWRNVAPVSLDLVVTRYELPLAVWLALAVVAGMVLALACLLPAWWRRGRERRQLERELERIRTECDRLRRQPMKDR